MSDQPRVPAEWLPPLAPVASFVTTARVTVVIRAGATARELREVAADLEARAAREEGRA